jgi:hypothetical protein
VTGEEFRALALRLPESVEGSHMGHPDFRVKKKIFATLDAAETGAAVRCAPANLDLLVQRDPESYRDAWRARWLGIALARIEPDEARALLEDGWRLVAPKVLAVTHIDWR